MKGNLKESGTNWICIKCGEIYSSVDDFNKDPDVELCDDCYQATTKEVKDNE